MEKLEFLIYLNKLEQRVIVPAIQKKMLGKIQTVPVRSVQDDYAPLGQLIGTRFRWTQPAVITYFNVRKRSTGFMAYAAALHQGYALRWASITVPVVAFASVKRWHVRYFEPLLLHAWEPFQKYITIAYAESLAQPPLHTASRQTGPETPQDRPKP